MPDTPRICITLGEPSGIGPEVVARALARLLPMGRIRPLVIGDASLFREVLRVLGLGLASWTVNDWPTSWDRERVLLLDRPLPASVTPGYLNPKNTAATIGWIESAARACLDGRADAMVTAPIDQRALRQAGHAEVGHTELLAALCGVDRPLMLLCGETLRVALVTTHLPLREVADSLSVERVLHTLRVATRGLTQDLGIDRPALGLASLNPHASDGGRFGDEERTILEPAVARAQEEGIRVEGPLPADTIFAPGVRERFDAIVCCYHDQGLAPLKALEFHSSVNITLNLPLVRTSPAHGVAYDLAMRRGTANAASMIRAIRTASEIAERRRT